MPFFSPNQQVPQQVQQQVLPNGVAGTVLESEDIGKWEMDVEPLLDKFYHKLLGEVENSVGEWVVNKGASVMMNELGASEIVQEIRARVHINMQMSELSEDRVIAIASRTGDIVADKLDDYYKSWGIKGSYSALRSIGWQVVDLVMICLYIAMRGGMKVHRERRGIKQYFNPQPSVDGGVM